MPPRLWVVGCRHLEFGSYYYTDCFPTVEHEELVSVSNDHDQNSVVSSFYCDYHEENNTTDPIVPALAMPENEGGVEDPYVTYVCT